MYFLKILHDSDRIGILDNIIREISEKATRRLKKAACQGTKPGKYAVYKAP